MADPQAQAGVNSAMLASMNHHSAGSDHVGSGSNVGVTGKGLGHALGGKLGGMLENSNMDNIMKCEGLGVPFAGNALGDPLESIENAGPVKLCHEGTIGSGANFHGSIGLDNVGFSKQTNANLPKVVSAGEQQH